MPVLFVRDHRVVAEPNTLHRLTESARRRLVGAAGRSGANDAAGLVLGMVTGDERLLSVAARHRMRDAGLGHLTAVSGANVAIVAVGLHFVLGLLQIARRQRLVVVGIAAAWFALIAGLEPSVLRACAMVSTGSIAVWRSQVVDTARALGVAVIATAVTSPGLLWQVGFQLSVVATAALIVAARWTGERTTPDVGSSTGRDNEQSLRDRLADGIRVALIAAVAAQAAVTPLLLFHGLDVPVVSVLANVLAQPVAALTSAIAFMAAAVALVNEPLGAVGVWLAAIPARLILVIADSCRNVTTPSLLIAMTGLSIGAVASHSDRFRALSRPTKRTVVVAGPLLIAAVLLSSHVRGASTVLEVTLIDVGQGDAVLLRTSEVTVLVDVGSGEQIVEPLLDLGVDHVDLLVLSHLDRDHVGGFDHVLAAVDVDVAWWTPDDEREIREHVGRRLDTRGVTNCQPEVAQYVLDDLVIEVLSPTARLAATDPNNGSIVNVVRWRGRTVVLTGDAGADAQDQLRGRLPQKVDVLKVPHHGADTNADHFLPSVVADHALIGVGADNPYGHPHPDVLAALDATGTTTIRTDLHGTSTVQLPPLSDATSADTSAEAPGRALALC